MYSTLLSGFNTPIHAFVAITYWFYNVNIVNLFYDYINPLYYYKLAFQMKYYHNFSLEEIENLIPWERQIYVEQIKKHLEEKEKNK